MSRKAIEIGATGGEAGMAGSQTARAVMELRDLIASGRMTPGDRFTEVQLADLLGVSRTPVRAALQRLMDEGLLESLAVGGYTVRSFLPREIAEAIEIRGMLEGLCARLLAERGTEKHELAALVGIVDRIDAVLDAPGFGSAGIVEYSTLNAEFHEALVAATGSSLLAQELARANARPFAWASALVHLHDDTAKALRHLTVAQDQHRAAIEAIESREGARAEAILREHARLSQRNLMKAVAARLPLDNIRGASLIRRPEDAAAE